MEGLEFFFEQAETGFVPRLDAGDILGGGIDVVGSVVASIHEARRPSTECISSEAIYAASAEEHSGGGGGVSEVVGDSNDLLHQGTGAADVREDGDAEGVVVDNSKGSCWTRRIRVGKASSERDSNPDRVPALEASMRAYADKKNATVVTPELGTSFDSV